MRRIDTHEPVDLEEWSQEVDFLLADDFDDLRLERMEDCVSGILPHPWCQPDAECFSFTCAELLANPGLR